MARIAAARPTANQWKESGRAPVNKTVLRVLIQVVVRIGHLVANRRSARKKQPATNGTYDSVSLWIAGILLSALVRVKATQSIQRFDRASSCHA